MPKKRCEISLEPTACYGTRVLRVPIPASTCPIRCKIRPIQASRPVDAAVLAARQRPPHQRRPQTACPRSLQIDSIPVGAASAANATGLVQTPQSKVPRTGSSALCPRLIRRGTSDWVIAFIIPNPRGGPQYPDNARPVVSKCRAH